MCGIAGYMSVDPAESRQRAIPAMLDAMQATMIHRGPDGAGQKVGPGVGLAFRRLAIRDLEGGQQPMVSEDGQVWSVMNGELYNYAELKQRVVVSGHKLYGHCDAEVIPHLYEELGLDGLLRTLRGMFALAIYDGRSDTLHVARDPFGIKPLYVAETREGFWFASQADALVAAGVPARVDPVSLWHYLTFQYVPGPATLWQGIRQVKPGASQSWRRGARAEDRYAELTFAPDEDWTRERAAAAVRAALEESVAAHLVSDVPVGAYLSGGIDSSAVVALMKKHQEVDSFSIGFAGATPERDELPRARRTAQALGSRHHELYVTARDYADRWEDIVRAQGDPVADPSAPALYFLADEARRHVKVVLSGEGADELFCGYAIYQEPLSLEAFDRIPPVVARGLSALANRLPDGIRGKSLIQRGTTPLTQRFLGNARIFREAEKASLLADGALERPVPPSWSLTAGVYEDTLHLPGPTRMQAVDLHFWLAGDILQKADKMSMAHSLEQRVPYLDRVVWDVARNIPASLQLAGGAFKRALRDAVSDLLPDEITHQPKLGFPVPLRQWLTQDLRPLAEDLVASSTDTLLRRDPVRSLLAGPRRFPTEDRKLWTVLTYLMWHRVFVERAVPIPAASAATVLRSTSPTPCSDESLPAQ